MSEWAKVQATNGAIVGFSARDHDLDVDIGSLNAVVRICDDWIEIINNWGCEAGFSRSTFDELGGHLAGTQIKEDADD